MVSFNILQELPEELLQDVLERLRRPDLESLNLASRWCYKAATPLIWREVELTDCRTPHEDSSDEHDDTPLIRKLLLLAKKPWLASCVHVVTHQCHLPPPAIFNELPINAFNSQTTSSDPRTIKLVELAVKAMKHVQTLYIILGHPNLTDALLRCFFDARRSRLGSEYAPIRKLWLENCRISAGLTITIDSHPFGLPLECNFSGLESIRLRRLPMRPGTSWTHASKMNFVFCRGGRGRELQDGTGGQYITTINDVTTESTAGENHLLWLEDRRVSGRLPPENNSIEASPNTDLSPLETLYQAANTWDDLIYQDLAVSEPYIKDVLEPLVGSLSHYDRSVNAFRGTRLDPDHNINYNERSFAFPYRLQGGDMLSNTRNWNDLQRERIPSSDAGTLMLHNASGTLTSLTLDWVLNAPTLFGASHDPSTLASLSQMYLSLLSCRFPHLRTFQFRNCVVPDTLLPEGLYLLGRSFPSARGATPPPMVRNSTDGKESTLDLAGLAFMEAHPKIQCLAWPMNHFFAPIERSAEIAQRVQAVVENLGRTLVDLRVDSLYSGSGEAQTEETFCMDIASRASRRRFISEFAAEMKMLESIKVEGGMPRDERREIIRALHACPLNKAVMIGVCCPLGNTWGLDGADIGHAAPIDSELDGLEGEDKSNVFEIGATEPRPPPPDFKYDEQYGWDASPPMLHTIASYHANTIKELKFCGYKGAPVLFSPTAITTPLLASLKHFHKLESVIMSMLMTTMFEGAPRDNEIISYWVNMRTPASTALVHITDEEPEGWAKELRTKFAPDALAWHITNFIGPFLSEEAKQTKGGVHVRASFCVGESGLFDVDLWVGKGAMASDVCLGYKGPREELEEERRRSKLENRRWF